MSIPIDSLQLVGWGGLAVLVFFLGLWVVQATRRDAGIVDVGWSLGVGAIAILLAVASNGWAPRRALVGAMAGFWSLRLAAHIFVHRVLREGEDRRYAAMRKHWGRNAQPLFLVFFLAQALLVMLFALPFVPPTADPHEGFRWSDCLGIGIWLVAVGGESVADRRLARFRARPENRGKTCREGLWRYSRHPNYFFEWLHWWSYVALGWMGPGGWLTLVGPALMFLFLIFITGIPYAERQAIESRGDDYRDYQRTTSMFIPLPPRRRTR